MTLTLVPYDRDDARKRVEQSARPVSYGEAYYGWRNEWNSRQTIRGITRFEWFLIRHGGVVWGLICVAICAAVGIAVAVTL